VVGLAGLGGIGMDTADLMSIGKRSYEDGCPRGGYDPAARLEVMDAESIDIVLLYPTIGIAWEGLIRDAKLATAYCRASRTPRRSSRHPDAPRSGR